MMMTMQQQSQPVQVLAAQPALPAPMLCPQPAASHLPGPTDVQRHRNPSCDLEAQADGTNAKHAPDWLTKLLGNLSMNHHIHGFREANVMSAEDIKDMGRETMCEIGLTRVEAKRLQRSVAPEVHVAPAVSAVPVTSTPPVVPKCSATATPAATSRRNPPTARTRSSSPSSWR
jgi:hypothetical protein